MATDDEHYSIVIVGNCSFGHQLECFTGHPTTAARTFAIAELLQVRVAMGPSET